MPRSRREHHRSERIGWLHAAVLDSIRVDRYASRIAEDVIALLAGLVGAR